MKRAVALAALLAALAAAPARGADDGAQAELHTDTLRVAFALAGGAAVRWEACHPTCTDAETRESFGQDGAAPLARLVAVGDAALSETLAALAYRAERAEDAQALTLELRSAPLADGVSVRQTWRFPRRGYEAALDVALEGPGAEAFARAHALWLAIDAPTLAQVQAGAWQGARSRFWALVARGTPGAPEAPGLLAFRVYSGPIERGLLRATDPALDALLFAHLWFWMRWLAFGLTFLLAGLRAVVGNAGVAVLLLAPCVKLLMRPLSATAERWQREVNELRTRLAPGIEAIKASTRGEERSRRLLELHREHGVTPFYGLKSLASLAIQVPIFFAAYHALDECFALAGVPFLWIRDLSEPDRLAAFPYALPFFGPSLNLLPFVMSGVTLLSSWLHDDGSLAPELLRRQRLGLYALAFAFFLLFYSFPAAMVLYWTSNNLVALAWEAVSRRLARAGDRTGRLAIGTIRR